MQMLRSLHHIARHPLNRGGALGAMWRIGSWQLRSRLARRPLVVPFVDDIRLLVRNGMTGATGNIYCGLLEYAEMALVMHALRPGDLFVDAGSNVGVYSMLASGVAGARSIAIEPVPATIAALRANIDLNGLASRVATAECALGEVAGAVRFTLDNDSMNRIASEHDRDTLIVPIRSLDSMCEGKAPTVLKIDVEGAELHVLRGAAEVLANPALHVVIVELWGETAAEATAILRSRGFSSFRYDPLERELARCDESTPGANAIFVRSPEWVADRVRSSPSRLVHAVRRFV